MKKKMLAILLSTAVLSGALTGCSGLPKLRSQPPSQLPPRPPTQLPPKKPEHPGQIPRAFYRQRGQTDLKP